MTPLIADPATLFDQFDRHVTYVTRELVNSIKCRPDDRLVESRDVAVLIASLSGMFACAVGTDANGAFAVHQERLLILGSVLEQVLADLNESIHA